MRKILVSILILSACVFAQADPTAVVATINDDIVVTLGEVMAEINTLPEDQLQIATTKEGVDQILDMIVRRKLLANKARMLQADTVSIVKQAVKRSEEMILADFIIMNIQRNTQSEPVTEGFAQEVYADNEQLFFSSAQVELKQIVALSEEEANTVKAALEGGGSFDDLMTKHPGNPQGARSGVLGFMMLNQLSPAVVNVVEGLQPGQWGGPVRTDSGYHFLLLISRRAPQKLAFEDIKEELIQTITNQRAQNAIDEYIKSLIDESKISIDNSVLRNAIVQPQQPMGF